jgi:hypothetical protein
MKSKGLVEHNNVITKDNPGLRLDKRKFQLVVGQRLAKLRAAIRPKLSQERLAAATNLSQHIIHRIEKGNGSLDNLLVVLNYYLNENYNLNYILAEDNSCFSERLAPADFIFSLEDYFEIPL